MKKEQIAVFEELLKQEGFKGKKQLRHVLWLNTSKPKFNIGECFKVTDRGHRIFGYPVKDFNARITAISSFVTEEVWRYELEAEVECDGKMYSTKIYKVESELIERCEGNKTVLGQPKSDCHESLEI